MQASPLCLPGDDPNERALAAAAVAAIGVPMALGPDFVSAHALSEDSAMIAVIAHPGDSERPAPGETKDDTSTNFGGDNEAATLVSRPS